MRAQWSLLTYDISDPKRLGRIHRLLRKKGIAVQQSVFLVRGTGRALNAILAQIDDIIEPDQDDIRSYPVAHPARFWSSAQISSSLPALDNTQSSRRSWKQRLTELFRRRGAA